MKTRPFIEDTWHSSGQSCRMIGDIYISYPDARMDDISMHYPASALWLYLAAENFAWDAIIISFTADR